MLISSLSPPSRHRDTSIAKFIAFQEINDNNANESINATGSICDVHQRWSHVVAAFNIHRRAESRDGQPRGPDEGSQCNNGKRVWVLNERWCRSIACNSSCEMRFLLWDRIKPDCTVKNANLFSYRVSLSLIYHQSKEENILYNTKKKL